jgi:predicted transcriptional regulator
MRRSKLEFCEDILGALIKKPLTVDILAYETNIGCTLLGQPLEFLIKNSLVEERVSEKKKTYAITEKGTAVLKALNFQKYLERVSNAVRVMDEALQTISTISERSNKKESGPGSY